MEYGERLTITTPEGVELDLVLAGIGSRFIAALLDLLIRGLAALAGVLLASALLDGGVLTLVLSVGAFLILFAYDVAFEVLAGGRTPGKRWTGLRVVRESGAPATFVISAIRNVLRIADFLPATYAIGMLSIFLTRRNQRLGDLAAATVVVRERLGGRVRAAAPAPAAGPVPIPAPVGWDTSAVTAEDVAVVRAFLERRHAIAPAAREHLAGNLAARLEAKVAGAPDLQPELFLEQLIAGRDGPPEHSRQPR